MTSRLCSFMKREWGEALEYAPSMDLYSAPLVEFGVVRASMHASISFYYSTTTKIIEVFL